MEGNTLVALYGTQGIVMNSNLDNQLIKSAQRGDTIAAHRLIGLGANVNYSSIPSFIHAYSNWHKDTAIYLLNSEANVNHDKSPYETILLMAVQRKDLSFVELLLSKEADVNHPMPLGGETVLFHAVSQNNFEMTKALVEAGAIVNHTAKMSVNSRLLNLDYFWGETPLHIAAICADENIVELLLSSGADLEAKTCKQQTPWDYAKHYLRPRAIVNLLDEGIK